MWKTFLLLDTNYLACRAFYSTGNLSYQDKATGVLYGVFHEIVTLVKEHDTTDLVFCFDRGVGKRQLDFPRYKKKRREKKAAMSPEEGKAWTELQDQLHALRVNILPELGFENVYAQAGYEADDMIAYLVKHHVGKEDEAVVVSADKDLYQLLRRNVCVWNPSRNEAMTKKRFKQEYGIPPKLWPQVKAIAGCDTDDVAGVKGVGEKTAVKFITGRMSKTARHYRQIKDFVASQDYTDNLALVKLPYYRMKEEADESELGHLGDEPTEDTFTTLKWKKVCDGLGFESLRNLMPGRP